VATAGYSGTPLHRKLGVRPGHQVLARDVPAGWPVTDLDPDGEADVALGELDGAESTAEVVVQFCPDLAALDARLDGALARTATGGRCWIVWPRRTGALAADLREDDVRAAALAVGWVDVKVCAVDRDWSGLCLMRRTRSAPRGPAGSRSVPGRLPGPHGGSADPS
jgi:hypothetical protein